VKRPIGVKSRAAEVNDPGKAVEKAARVCPGETPHRSCVGRMTDTMFSVLDAIARVGPPLRRRTFSVGRAKAFLIARRRDELAAPCRPCARSFGSSTALGIVMLALTVMALSL
jgi:hypothetical protein